MIATCLKQNNWNHIVRNRTKNAKGRYKKDLSLKKSTKYMFEKTMQNDEYMKSWLDADDVKQKS